MPPGNPSRMRGPHKDHPFTRRGLRQCITCAITPGLCVRSAPAPTRPARRRPSIRSSWSFGTPGVWNQLTRSCRLVWCSTCPNGVFICQWDHGEMTELWHIGDWLGCWLRPARTSLPAPRPSSASSGSAALNGSAAGLGVLDERSALWLRRGRSVPPRAARGVRRGACGAHIEKDLSIAGGPDGASAREPGRDGGASAGPELRTLA